MLFARKCLLVEGPIEKYAFDVLSNRFNYEFEDLTIIKANGKEKLKNLQLICKAFGIPYFTVFDLDDKDYEDDENKALKSFSGDSSYYTFPKTFEHVLGTQNADRKTSESMSRIEELDELPKPIKKALDAVDNFMQASN
ncbi:TOPRIM nucleotidyl transferase/hydrolase domain-containing protein [Halalkalibaculum sp. DA3122]|uniref:TOPRIM nucleotidyl transferase/hydrolase domain-containing protein n=1 Tax=Halalkalibaculum sp. DA3122 TaxID=3373607 RepID=UPI0037548978